MCPDVDPYIQKGMNKKPFVHPLLDSLTPQTCVCDPY